MVETKQILYKMLFYDCFFAIRHLFFSSGFCNNFRFSFLFASVLVFICLRMMSESERSFFVEKKRGNRMYLNGLVRPLTDLMKLMKFKRERDESDDAFYEF